MKKKGKRDYSDYQRSYCRCFADVTATELHQNTKKSAKGKRARFFRGDGDALCYASTPDRRR